MGQAFCKKIWNFFYFFVKFFENSQITAKTKEIFLSYYKKNKK
jgi:hypothetical protein